MTDENNNDEGVQSAVPPKRERAPKPVRVTSLEDLGAALSRNAMEADYGIEPKISKKKKAYAYASPSVRARKSRKVTIQQLAEQPVPPAIGTGEPTDVLELSEEEAAEAGAKGVICLGNSSYSVDSKGAVQVIKGHVWSHGKRELDYEDGVLRTIVTIDGIPIVEGTNIIFGDADTGKSALLKYIAQKAGSKPIRAGEPYPGYLRSTSELAAAMLNSEDSVLCVDSFKNVVIRLPGNATIGGLSKEFYATLSDLSSYFAERGQALVTVVNVGSSREDVIAESLQNIRSSATGFWHMHADGSVEWLIRVAEGQKRRAGRATIKWKGDGVIEKLELTRGANVPVVEERPFRSELTMGEFRQSGALSESLNRVLQRSRRNG